MKVLILLLSFLSFSCSAIPAPYSPPKDLPYIIFVYSCGKLIGFAGEYQGKKFNTSNVKQFSKFKEYVSNNGAFLEERVNFDGYYGKACGIEA